MRAGMAIVLATMAWAAQAADGPIYRWQDAQGQWHFSDAPQPGATALALRQGSVIPFAKPEAALAERAELSRGLARNASGAVSASQAAGAALARKKAYCSQRRDYLDSRELKAWCDLACRLPMEHEYDRECVQGVRW